MPCYWKPIESGDANIGLEVEVCYSPSEPPPYNYPPGTFSVFDDPGAFKSSDLTPEQRLYYYYGIDSQGAKCVVPLGQTGCVTSTGEFAQSQYWRDRHPRATPITPAPAPAPAPSAAFMMGPMFAPGLAAPLETVEVIAKRRTWQRALIEFVMAAGRGASTVLGLLWPNEMKPDPAWQPYKLPSKQQPQPKATPQLQPKPQPKVGRTSKVDYHALTIDLPDLIGDYPWPEIETPTIHTQPDSSPLDTPSTSRPPRSSPTSRPMTTPMPSWPTSTPSYRPVPFSSTPTASFTQPWPTLTDQPATTLEPAPAPSARKTPDKKCPPCTKEKQKKEAKRSKCYVQLVKQRTDPTNDTVRNWREITCR